MGKIIDRIRLRENRAEYLRLYNLARDEHIAFVESLKSELSEAIELDAQAYSQENKNQLAH